MTGSSTDRDHVVSEVAPTVVNESKNTKSKKENGKENQISKLMQLDAYQIREKESTKVGAIVTIVVLVATLVYIAMIIYQSMTSPGTQTTQVFWTIGEGPFPAHAKCIAYDGCYISNTLDAKWSTNVALKVDIAQTHCLKINYGEDYVFNITFSQSPLDGLQVIYNASNTNSSVAPNGYGLLLDSEANCAGLGLSPPLCVGGVMIMSSPVGPGFNLLTYVETMNQTTTGSARFRREWFVGKFSDERSIVPGSTPCSTSLPASILGSPDTVQSRLRFNTFYTIQTISKENVLLLLLGTAGGAYSLFLQVGSLLLITWTIWTIMSERGKSKVSPDTGMISTLKEVDLSEPPSFAFGYEKNRSNQDEQKIDQCQDDGRDHASKDSPTLTTEEKDLTHILHEETQNSTTGTLVAEALLPSLGTVPASLPLQPPHLHSSAHAPLDSAV